MTQINLGDRVKDRISGFTGIVIGITEYLYGCRRPIVQPSTLTTEGKPTEAQSFDEPQLAVLDTAVFSNHTSPAETEPGGPRATPQRSAHVTR